jgi:hypothetical protein
MDKRVFALSCLLITLLLVNAASALISTTSTSVRDVTYSAPMSLSSADVNTYWPILDTRDGEACRSRQDILLQVAPAGCQPTVVRSDLLAEQNVPVLCQLNALQINPLLDIKSIDSMTFSGQYPKEVATTGFYPARAGLSTDSRMLNNPVMNNVGYVVVVLKRQQNESMLPESVRVNLTARVRYDAQNALGIGQASFILPEQTESQFNEGAFKNSFWQGRYFVRADSLSADRANLVLYHEDRRITSLTVERGKQSSDIFIPGLSTCQASLKVAYDGFEQTGKDRARIEVQVNSQQTDAFDVYKGMTFYNGRCSVSEIIANADGTGNAQISCSGNDRANLLIQSNTPSSSTNTNQLSKERIEYLNTARQAIEEYKKVATLYSAEKMGSSTRLYGEEALQNALYLADSASLKNEYADLIALYQKTYPTSLSLAVLLQGSQGKLSIDTSFASTAFSIDGKVVQIRVTKFIRAEPATTNIIVGTQTGAKSYKQGDELILTEDRKNLAVIQSITADSVVIAPKVCANTRQLVSSGSLKEKQATTICGQHVAIQTINSGKIGTVRIIPNVNNAETVTNVSVTVGIEKRAIQLSPQKATEMIDNLNKSIQKWEGISTSLNRAVTGLKSACFATAAVLTAKNFISGLDGTALARKNVMQGVGTTPGWTARCTEGFRNHKDPISGQTTQYTSIDDCLRQNGATIDSDVERAKQVLSQQNQKLEQIDSNHAKDTQSFGKVVDTQGSAKEYITYLQQTYSTDPSIGKTVSSLTPDAYQRGLVNYDQLKQLEYDALILQGSGGSAVQRKAAQDDISSLQTRLQKNLDSVKTASDFAKSAGVDYDIQAISTNPRAQQLIYHGKATDGSITNIAAGTPVEYVVIDNVRYAAVLDANDGKTYKLNGLYQIDPTTKTATLVDAKSPAYSVVSAGFRKVDITAYQNKYLNSKVRYFETDPYKGMPALVPIDTNEGWYAGTQQLLPAFGQQSTYQSSGRVSVFWLCNVGPNGNEEFEKTGFGDDICQQFNLNTGQSLTKFDGLSDSKTQELVSRAVRALTQASQQYASGVNTINVGGQRYPVEPAVNVPAVRCQDYMSPKECLLLFNVCDPVICPSSRCDLGGQYHVANVPETGIVGSALLCLPNVREGIAVPVCLTGLQAGVDGFVSVMKSHRDCLQEQLQSGRTVGICDQIYSVYMCEFFWRQVAPVANLLLPKLVESAYGQGTHGGGEYLTVMEAWKQTQQSVSYFTQQYAVNSIKAFQLRSVEEAGGAFCKAFASAKAPTSFKSLVESDSPPQFHAWFSSIKFSDATVPATSQYKVYYHIFAGKDTGVTYQVYLKGPTTTSFYNVPSYFTVSSGFITRGQYASDTKDFTAPEGYKELCVRVNDREECGFQQVSTSFAVNYLTDQTRAETLKQTGVTSSQACVSGSVGTSVALSPNLQATAESIVTPQIYNQGIIRICATNNPGSTSAPGRFIDVGYCDNEKVRCWLDSESTARAITQADNGTRTEVNSALQAQQQANIAALQNQNVIFKDSAAFDAAYASVADQYGKLNSLLGSSVIVGANEIIAYKKQAQNIINQLADMDAKILYKNNNQKAQLQLLRARVFDDLARVLAPVQKQTIVSNTNANSPAPASIWTLDSALQSIMGLSLLEKYSTKPENEKFVDELYNGGHGLISEKEYIEINGNGILNVEEDLFFVQKLLTQKKAKELIVRKGEANLITASTAPEKLAGKAFYSTNSVSGSQIYIAGLPTFIYVGYVTTSAGTEERLYIPGLTPAQIGTIVTTSGNKVVKLNPGLNDDKYLGQALNDLLQNAIIGSASSVASTTLTPTAPSSSSNIISVRYTAGGYTTGTPEDLKAGDEMRINAIHLCDNLHVLVYDSTNAKVLDENMPKTQSTTSNFVKLTEQRYALQLECTTTGNPLETKTASFTITPRQSTVAP